MDIKIEIKNEADRGKTLVEVFNSDDVRVESVIIRRGKAKTISLGEGQYFKVQERK